MMNHESTEFSVQWSGGFPTMTPEPPAKYTLTTKHGGEGGSYVYQSDDMFDTDDDETAWTVSFETGDGSATITYFPSRQGVKLTASDSPGYEEGKQRALFGLVLIKLLRTGELLVKDL
jgi:hypothetical protein